MQDISGFSSVVQIVASNTFPQGITVTQFADDADPFDAASIKIAEVAMGLNGDAVTWAKAIPVPAVLNVIPGSEDDVNLAILANANKVGQGKTSAKDIITLTIIYPDGTTNTYNNGKITDFMPGKSIASAGRLKSRAYGFAFESNIGA